MTDEQLTDTERELAKLRELRDAVYALQRDLIATDGGKLGKDVYMIGHRPQLVADIAAYLGSGAERASPSAALDCVDKLRTLLAELPTMSTAVGNHEDPWPKNWR